MTPHFQSAVSPSAVPTSSGPSDSLDLPSAKRSGKALLASPGPKATADRRKKPDYGNASRWVTAYKLGFSLLVAGAANAFLFGVPLWWAAGLSAVVASAQSAIALKVHREDTPFSRKMVSMTRKMMRRDQDQTPAGKEWSMVPVWGAACGAMALVEAGFNHLYSKWNPVKPGEDPVEAHLTRIKQSIDKDDRFKTLYQLQKRGVEFTRDAKKWLKNWLRDPFPNQLPAKLKEMNHRLWIKLDNNVKGNPRAGYLVGFILAAIGGIAQTSIAAKIQERIDNNQDTNPKALLGAMKESASLKKNKANGVQPSVQPVPPACPPPAESAQGKGFFGLDASSRLSSGLNQSLPSGTSGELQSRPFGERTHLSSVGKENALPSAGRFAWQSPVSPAWPQTSS